MMKKSTLYILFVCLSVSVSFATYTYTITEYQGVSDLTGTESILFTGNGGTGTFGMRDFSLASIEGTSVLEDGTGGIWHIDLINSSSLEMSGGQVNFIGINNNAAAVFTGGLINQINSYQIAWKQVGDPPVVVPNPHITIVYSGDLPTLNPTTHVLTGLWGDGITGFSIYLPDMPNASPAINNIQFQLIPEPTTLLLLGLGGLLIRKKK